ncbi:MAG: hypothetical protein LBB15_01245 [Puniceicoccales bacterium]|jgi:hypothetical protein|nr:hypothetical protein [Puniceicoccales bacterium]
MGAPASEVTPNPPAVAPESAEVSIAPGPNIGASPGIPPSQLKIESIALNDRDVVAPSPPPPLPVAAESSAEPASANNRELIDQLEAAADKSSSLGFKGFFSALIDFFKNHVSWDQAALNAKVENFLQEHMDHVDEISDSMAENITTIDPKIFESYVLGIKEIGGRARSSFKEKTGTEARKILNESSSPDDSTAKTFCANVACVFNALALENENIPFVAGAVKKAASLETEISWNLLKLAHKNHQLFNEISQCGNVPQNLLNGIVAVQPTENIPNERLQKLVYFARQNPNTELTKLIRLCIENPEASDQALRFAKQYPNVDVIELAELYANSPDDAKKVEDFARNFVKTCCVPSIEISLKMAQLYEKDKTAFLPCAKTISEACKTKITPQLIQALMKLPDKPTADTGETKGTVIARFKKFAKQCPNVEVTPAVVALIFDRPDIADKIIENGINYSRQIFSNGGNDSGLGVQHGYKSYSDRVHDSLRNAMDGLFSEDNDAAVEEFLGSGGPFSSLYFKIDGIGRCEIPDMNLPNGVRVAGNRNGGEEFLRETEASQYTEKNYLKYVTEKFKAAYGDGAKDAFYVYLQNFTASGNTVPFAAGFRLHCPELLEEMWPSSKNSESFSALFMNALINHADRHVEMAMDENFNATYNILYDMPRRAESRENFGSLIAAMKGVNVDPPPWYGGNAALVASVRSYIPAAHNPNASDPWDQRGQHDKQETYTAFILSNDTPDATPA